MVNQISFSKALDFLPKTENPATQEELPLQLAYSLIKELQPVLSPSHKWLELKITPLQSNLESLQALTTSEAVPKILEYLRRAPECKKRNKLIVITQQLKLAMDALNVEADPAIKEELRKNIFKTTTKLIQKATEGPKVDLFLKLHSQLHQIIDSQDDASSLEERASLIRAIKDMIKTGDEEKAREVSSSSKLSPKTAIELLKELSQFEPIASKEVITNIVSKTKKKNSDLLEMLGQISLIELRSFQEPSQQPTPVAIQFLPAPYNFVIEVIRELKDYPHTTAQNKLIQSFKTAITKKDYLTANTISSSPDLSPSMALELLQHLASTNQVPKSSDATKKYFLFPTQPLSIIKNLITKSDKTPEDISLTLASSNAQNESITVFLSAFLPEIFPLINPRAALPLLYKVTAVLFQNDKENEAQKLYTLLCKKLPSTINRAGTWEKLAFKGGILSQYTYWSATQYSPADRFASIPKEDLKKFTGDFLRSKFLSTLAEGKTLKEIAETLKRTPIHRPQLSIEETLPWVLSHNLPIHWAKNFGFIEFLQTTKLSAMFSLYKHTSSLRNEPGFLVEGEWTSFLEISSRFRVEDKEDEKQIIEQTTGKRWYYLENGLVPYNPSKEIHPFLKTTPGKNHTISFLFMDEGNTDSLPGILRLSRHSWIQLKCPDGTTYSVGHLGSGIIRSPDVFEYVPGRKKKISFTITEPVFTQIFTEISRAQKEEQGLFNFLTNNCSSFSSKIAHSLPTGTQADAKGTLARYDTYINRIKFYVISSEISKAIFNTINLSKAAPQSPKQIAATIRSIINQGFFDIDESVVNILIGEIWEKNKKLLAGITQEINECVLQKNHVKLTNLFYNLISDIFTASQNFQIDLPPVLAEKLAKCKGATKVEFRS